jgi:hypothetical protein
MYRYTDEELKSAVEKNSSFAGVLRELNICQGGSSQAGVKKRTIKAGFSTAHFKGKANNFGVGHKGGCKKLTWSQVLVEHRRKRKESTDVLRRAMTQSGIPQICATCGLGSSWCGKFLVLQISHKNGRNRDNRKENLHFQCPNCHSQTDDFAGRGSGKNKIFSDSLAQRTERLVSTEQVEGSSPSGVTIFTVG